ncbi:MULTISPECIES: GNAT family N-acetyltransferase [unclassified Pseudomonas]|uniref:GNAT family N-acetyltransferase n=1 Tax=unclassified Pseudomonas TaxID=196821 RepID=UPI0025D41D7F|nr:MULTISPECIES: GNAT family N-acetyltransferase [unclassified Pseudomonas]
MNRLDIQQIMALPAQIQRLEHEAVAQGFRFVTRLIADWESGLNRFDKPGEYLMAVYRDDRLVAIGGLSRDPWLDHGMGRLRRLYVADAERAQGVGKTLVSRLLEQAVEKFRAVRLSTDTPEGAALYQRCGFQPVDDVHATHIRVLSCN